MTPADPHNAGDEHNQDAHEHGDINIRTVLLAALALASVAAILMVAMWGLFNVFEHQAAANDPQLSPLAVPAGQLPPEPRLQTNEPQGLKALRETEAKTLDSYGWVDEKSGVARVPIDQAKRLLLERGLPSREAAVDPATGTCAQAYGEASGGRRVGPREQ